MSVAQVEAAMVAAMSPNAAAQRDANAWLQAFQQSEQSWAVFLQLCQSATPNVAFFSANALLSKTRNQWRSLPATTEAAVAAGLPSGTVTRQQVYAGMTDILQGMLKAASAPDAGARPLDRPFVSRFSLAVAAAAAMEGGDAIAGFLGSTLSVAGAAPNAPTMTIALSLLGALGQEAISRPHVHQAAAVTAARAQLPSILRLLELVATGTTIEDPAVAAAPLSPRLIEAVKLSPMAGEALQVAHAFSGSTGANLATLQRLRPGLLVAALAALHSAPADSIMLENASLFLLSAMGESARELEDTLEAGHALQAITALSGPGKTSEALATWGGSLRRVVFDFVSKHAAVAVGLHATGVAAGTALCVRGAAGGASGSSRRRLAGASSLIMPDEDDDEEGGSSGAGGGTSGMAARARALGGAGAVASSSRAPLADKLRKLSEALDSGALASANPEEPVCGLLLSLDAVRATATGFASVLVGLGAGAAFRRFRRSVPSSSGAVLEAVAAAASGGGVVPLPIGAVLGLRLGAGGAGAAAGSRSPPLVDASVFADEAEYVRVSVSISSALVQMVPRLVVTGGGSVLQLLAHGGGGTGLPELAATLASASQALVTQLLDCMLLPLVPPPASSPRWSSAPSPARGGDASGAGADDGYDAEGEGSGSGAADGGDIDYPSQTALTIKEIAAEAWANGVLEVPVAERAEACRGPALLQLLACSLEASCYPPGYPLWPSASSAPGSSSNSSSGVFSTPTKSRSGRGMLGTPPSPSPGAAFDGPGGGDGWATLGLGIEAVDFDRLRSGALTALVATAFEDLLKDPRPEAGATGATLLATVSALLQRGLAPSSLAGRPTWQLAEVGLFCLTAIAEKVRARLRDVVSASSNPALAVQHATTTSLLISVFTAIGGCGRAALDAMGLGAGGSGSSGTGLLAPAPAAAAPPPQAPEAVVLAATPMVLAACRLIQAYSLWLSQRGGGVAEGVLWYLLTRALPVRPAATTAAAALRAVAGRCGAKLARSNPSMPHTLLCVFKGIAAANSLTNDEASKAAAAVTRVLSGSPSELAVPRLLLLLTLVTPSITAALASGPRILALRAAAGSDSFDGTAPGSPALSGEGSTGTGLLRTPGRSAAGPLSPGFAAASSMQEYHQILTAVVGDLQVVAAVVAAADFPSGGSVGGTAPAPAALAALLFLWPSLSQLPALFSGSEAVAEGVAAAASACVSALGAGSVADEAATGTDSAGGSGAMDTLLGRAVAAVSAAAEGAVLVPVDAGAGGGIPLPHLHAFFGSWNGSPLPSAGVACTALSRSQSSTAVLSLLLSLHAVAPVPAVIEGIQAVLERQAVSLASGGGSGGRGDPAASTAAAASAELWSYVLQRVAAPAFAPTLTGSAAGIVEASSAVRSVCGLITAGYCLFRPDVLIMSMSLPSIIQGATACILGLLGMPLPAASKEGGGEGAGAYGGPSASALAAQQHHTPSPSDLDTVRACLACLARCFSLALVAGRDCNELVTASSPSPAAAARYAALGLARFAPDAVSSYLQRVMSSVCEGTAVALIDIALPAPPPRPAEGETGHAAYAYSVGEEVLALGDALFDALVVLCRVHPGGLKTLLVSRLAALVSAKALPPPVTPPDAPASPLSTPAGVAEAIAELLLTRTIAAATSSSSLMPSPGLVLAQAMPAAPAFRASLALLIQALRGDVPAEELYPALLALPEQGTASAEGR